MHPGKRYLERDTISQRVASAYAAKNSVTTAAAATTLSAFGARPSLPTRWGAGDGYLSALLRERRGHAQPLPARSPACHPHHPISLKISSAVLFPVFPGFRPKSSGATHLLK